MAKSTRDLTNCKKELGSFPGLHCAWQSPPLASFCLFPFSALDKRVLPFLPPLYYRLRIPLQEYIQCRQWHTLSATKLKMLAPHLRKHWKWKRKDWFSRRRLAAIQAAMRLSSPQNTMDTEMCQCNRYRDAQVGSAHGRLGLPGSMKAGQILLMAHKPAWVWKWPSYISRRCWANPVTLFLDRSNMLKWHFSSLQLLTGSYLHLTDPHFMLYHGKTTWFLPWQNHLVPLSSLLLLPLLAQMQFEFKFLSKPKIFILNQLLRTASEYLMPADTEKCFISNTLQKFYSIFQGQHTVFGCKKPLIISWISWHHFSLLGWMQTHLRVSQGTEMFFPLQFCSVSHLNTWAAYWAWSWLFTGKVDTFVKRCFSLKTATKQSEMRTEESSQCPI